MKAALISLGSTSSQWTLDAMSRHFDVVDSIDVRKIEINIGAKKDARLLYGSKQFPSYDCIYAKGSFRFASILRAVTALLGDTCYMPIRDSAFTLVHNKLLSHIVLQQHEIPMPITYLSASGRATKKLLERISYPIVLKFPEGTQGKGVMFADTYAAASSWLDALRTLKQPCIIQEYVETGSTDIRAIVVGDRVVASMQRIAVHGEKRANIHAGGIGEAVELDTHTKKIAVRAAQALGAGICGVDMLTGAKGPQVIELNLSPGLQGIKKATGTDVAEHIAKYLARQAAEYRQADTKKGTDRILGSLGIVQGKEIITNIDMRANRILLPEIATRLAGFDEGEEMLLRVGKNRIEILRP